MNRGVLFGIIISILSIMVLSVYSGIKNAKNKNSELSVLESIGLLMGTVVGGSSTIGTAQLAFTYGMSAWWFTLGIGIGCLILVRFFYKPIKETGSKTLVGVISIRYGQKAGATASVLNSVGMFINILSQLLACAAVVNVVFPNAANLAGLCIGAFVMVAYVVIGGIKGAGKVGLLKTALLYFSMTVCGITALKMLGGISGTTGLMRSLSAETGNNYFSLFSRGLGTDLGAALSIVLGIITTQTYVQALLLAKTEKAGKIGGMISALLSPVLGIFGILVGLYMRKTVADPLTYNTKAALTSFILDHSGLPGIVAGIVLGTLFIASVGTGAGLALGISTVVDKELLKKEKSHLNILIIGVLGLAVIMSCLPIGDVILKFAFMSMGLRGCTVFAPLCFALWSKRKLSEKSVVWSIVSGSVITLVLGIINMIGIVTLPCDAVFFGITAAVAVLAAEAIKNGKK